VLLNKEADGILSQPRLEFVSIQILWKIDLSTGHQCTHNWEFVTKGVKIKQLRAICWAHD